MAVTAVPEAPAERRTRRADRPPKGSRLGRNQLWVWLFLTPTVVLYGVYTVAVTETDGRVALRRFRVPEAWIPVAFIPQRESRTVEMRAALPPAVPHAAAARQAGRSALLATAIMTSDAGLLRAAMADELHQPYRLPLLPGSRELMELAYERGAAGACLSGAGPTVLAICDSPAGAHAVEKAWNAAGVPGMATRLRFDTSGAKLVAD